MYNYNLVIIFLNLRFFSNINEYMHANEIELINYCRIKSIFQIILYLFSYLLI